MKYLIIKFIPTKLFLKLKYYYRTGEKLNLKNPVTYNEKLQWLKIYDRNPEYTKMVDKYEAKKYVSNVIGSDYIIPTIGIYDNFDEIDFSSLPNQFVIKCTHDSGGVVICKDKSKFDLKKYEKKFRKSLKKNYYYLGREYPYKNVKPRIIIEKYMENKNGLSVRDYKFFCFNGKPEIMYVSEDSHTDKQSIAFFDMNFEKIDCERKDYKPLDSNLIKPKNFEKMKNFASILSKGIPHLRVDFYEINDHLYFSELTFYTGGGMIPFKDKKWDEKLGKLINLELVKKIKTTKDSLNKKRRLSLKFL